MAGGLRERKRRELRVALSVAAAELAQERGLNNVRVEDVVGRVGVSRRTFSNYFASKEEAIVDRHLQRAERTAEVLRGRPRDEPLWDALTAAVLAPYAAWHVARTVQPQADRDAMITVLSHPDLQAAIVRGSRTARAELAGAVAERVGAGTSTDLYPSLVADVALTSQLFALDQWLRCDPPVALLPLLQEVLTRLGAGLRTGAGTDRDT